MIGASHVSCLALRPSWTITVAAGATGLTEEALHDWVAAYLRTLLHEARSAHGRRKDGQAGEQPGVQSQGR
jgi:hypothetical protein